MEGHPDHGITPTAPPTNTPPSQQPPSGPHSNPAQPAPLSPAETDRLLAAWQLSPEQHDAILHDVIIPTELGPYLPAPPRDPSTRPLVVLVLGQTGAGKTLLAPRLLEAMATQTPHHRRAPFHLIADTYKPHHPHYTRCLALLPPHHASRLTSHHAARWLQAVCARAAGHGLDVLVEAACRREGDLQRLVEAFTLSRKENGEGEGYDYDIHVAVLAVPAALSRLGILTRYWKRAPEAGVRGLPVRLTPRGVHDESFEGLEGGVGWVDGVAEESAWEGGAGRVFEGVEGGEKGDEKDGGEKGGARDGGEGVGKGKRGEKEEGGKTTDADRNGRVDRIVVVRRNGLVVYSNSRRTDGKAGWQSPAGALKALQRERARGLSPEERRAAEADIAMLRGLENPKVDKEVEEIEALMAGLGTVEDGAADVTPFDAVGFVWRGLSS